MNSFSRALVIAFLFFVCVNISHAQNIDSLKTLLKNATSDTVKCKLLSGLIELEADPEIWPKYNDELKTIAEKNLSSEAKGSSLYKFYSKYKAIALGNVGFLCIEKGDLAKAKDVFLKALDIELELGDKRRLASCYNNLGQAYSMQGDIVKALQCSEKALFAYEQLNDMSGIGLMLNNLAVIYEGQGETKKALEYGLRSLKNSQKLGKKKPLADAYSNVGYLYKVTGDLDKAMEYYEFSLRIREEIKDKRGVAISLNNIGRLFEKKKEYDKALDYFKKVKTIYDETQDKDGLALVFNNIGNIYSLKGQLDLALENSSKGLAYAKEAGAPQSILKSASVLRDIYVKKGNYSMAYKMQELAYQMKDSISNKETQSAAIKNQLKYEYGKKAIADSIKALEEKRITDLEITSQQAQIKQERTTRYALVVGLLLVMIFAIFIFNRFKLTQKQKAIINDQKHEVELQKSIIEEKQKEIVDSINYAKRLQDAIMPTKHAIDEVFPDNFIYYKPKDIVAGDFYWMESRNDLVYIAAADCTGHGVPGALVSVVCSNALDRSVLEFGLTEPGAILNKTRELVVATFEKSSADVKDGMDISLCCFNVRTKVLTWSGANNPLWLVKDVDGKKQFVEIKATKQPVGKIDRPIPFKTEQIELRSRDALYLFTDGYADQFGGKKGKKFKYKALEQLLVKNHEKPMSEQNLLLSDTIETWRGSLEQVDDILIIGIRV